jgi:hypothetical protein
MSLHVDTKSQAQEAFEELGIANNLHAHNVFFDECHHAEAHCTCVLRRHGEVSACSPVTRTYLPPELYEENDYE